MAKTSDGIEILVGKDYPEMCKECQAEIDRAATILGFGPDVADTGGPVGVSVEDPEGPCMYAYDMGWFCDKSMGGTTCAQTD